MATNKIERGPTSERVAANVKAVREARRLSLEALSQRMGEIGRPILRTGLAKIESGERRVDVDDLMALAIALQVTPNRLLLISPVPDQVDPLESPGYPWLAPKFVLAHPEAWKIAWNWACGGISLGFKGWQSIPALEWMKENRPHNPPVFLRPDEWRKLAPFEKRFEELRAEVESAGFEMRALFDDTVFEAHDASQEHTGDFDHGDDES